MKSNRLAVLLLFFSLVVDAHTSARGSLFSLLGGNDAIRDAGNKADDILDHAHRVADALLATGNANAQARLTQINDIANNAFDKAERLKNSSTDDVLRILDRAKADISTIEALASDDLNRTIWNAECGGKRLLIEDLGAAMGGLGRFIGTNEIFITPPVKRSMPWYHHLCFWCSDEVSFKVRQPFANTYIEIRDFMNSSLANIKYEASANSIPATYDYIAEFAKKTSCFYQSSSLSYNQEYVKYHEKAELWRRLLAIEMER